MGSLTIFPPRGTVPLISGRDDFPSAKNVLDSIGLACPSSDMSSFQQPERRGRRISEEDTKRRSDEEAEREGFSPSSRRRAVAWWLIRALIAAPRSLPADSTSPETA